MAMTATASELRVGSWNRLLPLSGLGFVVLAVIALVGLSGDTPGADDSAATIGRFYDSHYAQELAASLVIAAAAPLLVLFGISLALALWPGDGSRRPFWQIVLGAGSALAGGTWLVAAFVHFALTDASNQSGMAGGALQALNVLDADSWVVFNSGLGVLMLGAGAAMLARKTHPVLGWIGLVAGVVLFVPFADFPALIVSGLWIIVTSIQLFRRGPAFAGGAV
jgi:hypothetical protein